MMSSVIFFRALRSISSGVILGAPVSVSLDISFSVTRPMGIVMRKVATLAVVSQIFLLQSLEILVFLSRHTAPRFCSSSRLMMRIPAHASRPICPIHPSAPFVPQWIYTLIDPVFTITQASVILDGAINGQFGVFHQCVRCRLGQATF